MSIQKILIITLVVAVSLSLLFIRKLLICFKNEPADAVKNEEESGEIDVGELQANNEEVSAKRSYDSATVRKDAAKITGESLIEEEKNIRKETTVLCDKERLAK